MDNPETRTTLDIRHRTDIKKYNTEIEKISNTTDQESGGTQMLVKAKMFLFLIRHIPCYLRPTEIL